ncbi:ASST-domain-containing protein [Calycina marina]|uniref:ASST-domain-containing protein n=1 Tax=Calycina marina TaxID=1763456 RepID=A0A9P7Z0B6_9HELO|nr:ASST-domain-containing protein [Calycina marina]
MRPLLLFGALPICHWAVAFSFNAFDLGFHGIYPRQRFHSFDLEAPVPKIRRWDSRCDYGNILLSPRGKAVPTPGPVMLDAKGNLVWMENKFGQVMNFNVQNYKGQDYMTFWMGIDHAAHSNGSYVLIDSSYEIVHRVYAHGINIFGDLHEFRITPQGTAIMTIYHVHEVDCTDIGLGDSCWINDGLFQEVDIETGDLIFEWRATDHVPLSDVFVKPSYKGGKSEDHSYDFFHINSVDKMDSGDYIISSRYAHAIICISANTGDILWQLGGKNNNFKDMNLATDFSWQHHTTWLGNNTLSLFDNHGNNVFHRLSDYSKGMIIQLDMEDMTATLLKSYAHPDKISTVSQGSVQVIPENGNVLVGFGNSPTYTEFSADGEMLCSAHFGPYLIFEILDFGLVKSYRTFKSAWVGRPKTVPDVKVENGKMYVSWNGATEVAWWRLETAETLDDEFLTVQELEREGFETSFELHDVDRHLRIVALDAARSVMEYSVVVSMTSTSFVSPIPYLNVTFLC